MDKNLLNLIFHGREDLKTTHTSNVGKMETVCSYSGILFCNENKLQFQATIWLNLIVMLYDNKTHTSINVIT